MTPNDIAAAAILRGVEKNILMCVGGGIGDQICAEPTLRYAIETFTDCKINLLTPYPELFNHMTFEDKFNFGQDKVEVKHFLPLMTYGQDTGHSANYLRSLQIPTVDYCSLHALKCSLPLKYKHINLAPQFAETWCDGVYIHPGKGWPSKTFPKRWWEALISWVKHYGLQPIVIGTKEQTVNVEGDFIDLRGKFSISQTIYLLQHAKNLVTNDSSPIHFASTHNPTDPGSGHSFIDFIATVKHPDHLLHYRHGSLGYRMKNHSKGGIWSVHSFCPNKAGSLDVRQVEEDLLVSWLPCPQTLAEEISERSE